MYYVYAHTKPGGEIFYIGKGTRRRAWSVCNRNQHWHNVVNKHSYEVVILADELQEIKALEEEAKLIEHFKKFNCLVNVLDRGDINPMSNPEVAKRVANTKREKGQYSGKEISAYNAQYKEKMATDPEFAKQISEKRSKAGKEKIKKLYAIKKEMVLEVRKLRAKGCKLKDIGNKFGISQSTVCNIAKGNTYANIS